MLMIASNVDVKECETKWVAGRMCSSRPSCSIRWYMVVVPAGAGSDVGSSFEQLIVTPVMLDL